MSLRREEAVEVVEADVLGLALQVLAQVPLADGLGDVAGVVQQLASVTSPCRPPRSPYMGGRCRPWRMGSRPVRRVARDGVHDGSE